MSSIYLKIELHEIDPGILERISERDVVLWMAARLQQIRLDLPVHNMSVAVIMRTYPPGEEYIDIDWTGHTKTDCATCQCTSASLCARLRDALYDRPGERAREKRLEATRLIDQAAQLEAIAKKGAEIENDMIAKYPNVV